jgi:hypothetical protein
MLKIGQSVVLFIRKHLKVVFVIVQSIIVNVVDVFISSKGSTEDNFSNNAMFPFPFIVFRLYFPVEFFDSISPTGVGLFSRANWTPLRVVGAKHWEGHW